LVLGTINLMNMVKFLKEINMRKWLLLLFLISLQSNAQTGIGTTTPNASAKLDVYATNKGFLPPRVTLTSATDATTIASPAEGLLVYNLGSVGLQAGYYYWNNANWATIATATSAGNGLTASDLVKIYDGVGNAATINSTGATFSVTTSGKYLFDFSTSATCSNCTVTLNFQVRDGANSNAVIASDMQTSYSNNVHSEYNGKVEANLLAGRSYNVLVTASSGGIYGNDYTRVYMKQVAGNLPVTGQTVDYAMASLSANQSITAASNVLFNTIQGTGITLNNGGFNLIANKTYKLEGAIGGSSTGYIYYAWVDATNTIISGGSVGSIMKAGATYSDGPQDKAIAYYTPSANTTVYLRVLSISGTSVAYPASATPSFSSTWASISQIGSSAIINPWVLSGTNTYNTTGNIGIGTTAPSTSMHIENGNSIGSGNPASTTGPSLFVYNNNNASTTAHATALVRTAGSGSGNPYYALDVNSVGGYSMGINNATSQFMINTMWNFATGTAANNALTINRSGQSRVVIPSDGGATAGSWPTGWGGSLMTFDIACAGIYYNVMTARSDRRLKNTIVDLDVNTVSKYLQLRPVNYYWNDKSDNNHKQYGLIAQEVEALFPDIVSVANDSMQTKSINYQALHALSLKVIQAQQVEIDTLKKNQVDMEQRLIKLEAKLN